MNRTWHGVYKGPVPRLAGKGALLRIKGGKLFAQFDDVQQPEAYGWLEVLRCDFKIRPRGRGTLWSNRLNPIAPARKHANPAVMYAPYGGDEKAIRHGLAYQMGAAPVFFSNPCKPDWIADRYCKS